MARENDILLVGKIINIEKDNINKIAQLQVEVVRRNGKRLDYPSILVTEEHYDIVKDMEKNDIAIIKGFFATMTIKDYYKCPECGKQHEENINFSGIIAFWMLKMPKNSFSLSDFQEISNNGYFLGPLCRHVKLKELPSGVKNAQYQMVLGRKMKVKGQENIISDMPFVSSLGKQAEEDAKRMEEGSSCWINGGIQTRQIYKNYVCEECGTSFSKDFKIMEIVPYHVEYLFNCNFDDRDKEE